MESRRLLLSVMSIAAVGLVGCQTVKKDENLSMSETSAQIQKVSWGKSGDIFQKPSDEILKANESRIIFFRDADNSEQPKNINVGIGLDNVFQSSLQNGHFSEQIVCRGSHIINASVLKKKSGDVDSYANNYQFIPQTTTYLKVDLSTSGSPIVKQIPTEQALVLLQQSTRQTHQISRVPSDCEAMKQVLSIQTLSNQNLANVALEESATNNQIDGKNLKQLSVQFDFDSTNIKNNDAAVLDGMANFVQSYPETNIILEDHTDSKESESYNLKLFQNRADRVKGILVDKYGMESTRLSAIGYKEVMPIDTNDIEQGRQNNRRVVTTVSERDS